MYSIASTCLKHYNWVEKVKYIGSITIAEVHNKTSNKIYT